MVSTIPYAWAGCCIGAAVMAASYLISPPRQFVFRWLFGAGLFFFIFGLFAEIFQYRNTRSEFTFPGETADYIGTVLDIPLEKRRSIALNVKISYPVNKKIAVYLQKDGRARRINAGEEIVFAARIQPFRNLGNPDDFDYVRFMRNKGFAGSAYLPSGNWCLTGNENISLYILAQKVRKKALDFYRLLELDSDAYSFISALTLGYKHDLTNELQEAFRASGTSHVLAVSGLHVSIFYVVFTFLFSFLGKSGKKFVLQQILVVIVLWLYAFLAGLSPSILRATVMFTIASVGIAWKRRGFTYNTLTAAAFFLLAHNPLNLFDVGFQMSFAAVWAILSIAPLLHGLYQPRQRVSKYAWDLFVVSTSAQIGVFPIALYYFGTFPTYFFVTNMLVVPLVGLIIYVSFPMILAVVSRGIDFILFEWIFQMVRWIFRSLIQAVLQIVYCIESVPFSQFSGGYISVGQLFLLLVMVVLFSKFAHKKQAWQWIAVLSCSSLFLFSFVYDQLTRQPDSYVVFNKPDLSDIGLYVNRKRIYPDLTRNGLIPHREKKILVLSENRFNHMVTEKPFPLDVLVLSEDRTFSIGNLAALFHPELIVLDSSFPQPVRNNLVNECVVWGIPVHDVSENGAFYINF